MIILGDNIFSGGSNTTIVLVDIDGNILADSIGLGTNQYVSFTYFLVVFDSF